MGEFRIDVVADPKDGREQELRERLSAVVGPARRDAGGPGCDLFVDQGDARRFVWVEDWASLAAQERHHTHAAQIRRFQDDGIDAVERFELLIKLDRVA